MRVLTLVAFIFCTLHISAQTYIVHVDQYDIQHGLSSRQVNSLCKDSRGLLWIATKYGLNSYNGNDFKIYTREKDSLPYNYIDKVMTGEQGHIYLFGPLNTIAVYNPLTNKSRLLADEHEDFKRYIFYNAITDKRGVLYACNRENDTVWIYSETGGLIKKRLQGYFPLTFLHAGPRNTIYAIARKNTLIEMDSALNILHEHTFPVEIKTSTFGAKEQGFILREDQNYLTPRLFYVANTGSITEIEESTLPPRDTSRNDFTFYTETDEVLWRQGGLYNGKTQLMDLYKTVSTDLSGVVRTILVGRDKEIWIGNNFGLYKVTINRNKFTNYFKQPVFAENNKNSYRGLYATGDSLVANCEAHGMFVAKASTGQVLSSIDKDQFGGFTCLLPDGHGYWLQGYFGGLRKTNARTGAYKEVLCHLTEPRVWCIYPLQNNTFLCGTEVGIIEYNNTTETYTTLTWNKQYDELKRAFVIGILKEPGTNTLWLCTDKGLFAYTATQGVTGWYNSTQPGAHKLPLDNIYTCSFDTGSVVWLGCNEGLVRWDRKNATYNTYAREHGLSDNTIYAVFDDGLGYLWLSSNYGLMHFEKATGAVKSYLMEDGVANNEFNRLSGYQHKNGMLYFGTLNGVTGLNPQAFVNDKTVMKVPLIITGFKKFDSDRETLTDQTTEVLTGKEIIIKPDDRLFTVEYRLLHSAYTGQNIYASKVDDDEQTDWVYTKEHTLNFARLPYGRHTLFLKGRSSNTAWSNQVTIQLLVLRPFYLQLWFFVLVFVLVALAIAAYIIRRTYVFKLEQERLELEVARKTATISQQTVVLQQSLNEKEILLKEIHHRVKNNLQVISGLLGLQARDSNNAEVKTTMQEGRNRINSMALIHQMLYLNEDLQHIKLDEYLAQLTAELKATGAYGTQQIDIIVTASGIELDLDTAIPVGLIVNELTTNALKHAFGNKTGTIQITVTQTGPHSYSMLFKDSGIGLPPGFDFESSRTLGLRLVKMLCTQIRATVNFKSEQGTAVTILFTDNWKEG